MAPRFNIWAILPLLVTLTALALAFLCVFAGSTPSFMEDYSVLTLNTSRIGQNAVDKIEDKILSFNASSVLQKRDAAPYPSVLVSITYIATTTAAPDPKIDLRDLSEFVNGISQDAASLRSEAGAALTSAAGAVESKATALASSAVGAVNSVEGLVASKISSAIYSVQTAAVQQVDSLYVDFLSSTNLTDFYSVHMLTTCEGEYVTSNGTNITIGSSPAPLNGTHRVVTECSKHSSLNPLGLIRILFEIGIAFTGIATLTAIWGLVRFSRTSAIINILASLPALGVIAVATAITHGLAVGAAALINFLGGELGIKVTYGGKFIALAWATTILLLVDLILWTLLLLGGERLPGRGSRKERKVVEKEKNLPEHEMRNFTR